MRPGGSPIVLPSRLRFVVAVRARGPGALHARGAQHGGARRRGAPGGAALRAPLCPQAGPLTARLIDAAAAGGAEAASGRGHGARAITLPLLMAGWWEGGVYAVGGTRLSSGVICGARGAGGRALLRGARGPPLQHPPAPSTACPPGAPRPRAATAQGATACLLVGLCRGCAGARRPAHAARRGAARRTADCWRAAARNVRRRRVVCRRARGFGPKSAGLGLFGPPRAQGGVGLGRGISGRVRSCSTRGAGARGGGRR
jgi:hypothetical protein